MKLTERHTFKTDKKQKVTLMLLHSKYKENTSEFIRQAISEKLEREKDTIYKNYREIQSYINSKKRPF